jgi:hypothetical protein
MDEALSVLRRLRRIEALEREGASARSLLAEVHALVDEAEAWVARAVPRRIRSRRAPRRAWPGKGVGDALIRPRQFVDSGNGSFARNRLS